MNKKNKTKKNYVYFAISSDNPRIMKIGESGNLENRQNVLWCTESINVSRYVSFDGTEDERVFVESWLRSRYSTNSNLKHFGKDHFKARTKNNLKGAENKFFIYVAEALAALESMKNKQIDFNAYTGRYSRYHTYAERLKNF